MGSFLDNADTKNAHKQKQYINRGNYNPLKKIRTVGYEKCIILSTIKVEDIQHTPVYTSWAVAGFFS